MKLQRDKRILELPIGAISPNPAQPRRLFEPEALEELSASIGLHGILQPLTVRRKEGHWELVAGERRLRAAKLSGLKTVPCIEAKISDRESALLALVENLQRRDLHYFEEAAAISQYIQDCGITQEEAARALGRSPSALANKLRLLRLSPQCREKLLEAGLTERHARTFLRLEDEEQRLKAIDTAAEKKLNVAQTEQLVERLLAQAQAPAAPGRRTFILKDVRFFLNSVERGLQLMREAGVRADQQRQETEEEIILTIHLPKGHREAKSSAKL